MNRKHSTVIVPSVVAAMQRDPRYALGQNALVEGSSTAPVASVYSGIARALQGALGGYMLRKAGDRYGDQQDAYMADQRAQLAKVLGVTAPEYAPFVGGNAPPQPMQAPNAPPPAPSSAPPAPPPVAAPLGSQMASGTPLAPPPSLSPGMQGVASAVNALPPDAGMGAYTNDSMQNGGITGTLPRTNPDSAMNPAAPTMPGVPDPRKSTKLALALALMGGGNPYSFTEGQQGLDTGLAEDAQNKALYDQRKYEQGMKQYDLQAGDYYNARQQSREFGYNRILNEDQFKHQLRLQHDSQGFEASQHDIDRAWQNYRWHTETFGSPPEGGVIGAFNNVTGGSGHGTTALSGNNPGGINDGKFAQSQPGYAGPNGRYAAFDTIEHGVAAQKALLKSYVSRGYDTPAKIASRWAPSSDGNDPASYAANIAKSMGIGINDKITAANLDAFQHAQAVQENAAYGHPSSKPPRTLNARVIDAQLGPDTDPNDPRSMFGNIHGKPLPQQRSKDLNGLSDKANRVAQLKATMKDSYFGNPLENADVGLGRLSGGIIGAPDDEVQWWQNYQDFKNTVRHDLFGSALTAHEQAEFDKAAITPGMSRKQVENNLNTQQTIVEAALSRHARAAGAAGFNSGDIYETLGPDLAARIVSGNKPQPSAKPPETVITYGGRKYAMRNGMPVDVTDEFKQPSSSKPQQKQQFWPGTTIPLSMPVPNNWPVQAGSSGTKFSKTRSPSWRNP